MQNHLGLALANQQNNLRDLASSNARLDLQKANLGLQGAQFQNQLNRQKKYEDPILQRRVDQINVGDQPLNRSMFQSSLEHRNKMMDETGGWDAIASALGGEYDPQSGNFMRNGQPIPKWEYDSNPNYQANVKRIKWAHVSPAQDIEFNRALIEDKQANGEALSPQETQYYNRVSNMGPSELAEVTRKDLQNMQYSYSKMLEDPEVPDSAKQAMLYRIQAQAQELQGLQGQLSSQAKNQFDINKLREEYRLKGELENQKQIAGGGKDNRGTFQKNVEFFSWATGMPLDESAELFRIDKTRADRLKMASEVLAASEMDLMSMEPPERQAFIEDIYRRFELLPNKGTKQSGQPVIQPQVGQDGSILTDTLPAQPDENGIVTIDGVRYKVDKVGGPEVTQARKPQAGEAQAAPAPVAPVKPVQPALSPQQINQNGWTSRTRGLSEDVPNIFDNLTDEEKKRRIDAKNKRDRRSFYSKPPMVN